MPNLSAVPMWQDFEFSGAVDATNLAVTDHTAIGSWTTYNFSSINPPIIGTTAERKTLGSIAGGPDNGTRGLVVPVTGLGAGTISYWPGGTPTKTSYGFWFQFDKASISAFGLNEIWPGYIFVSINSFTPRNQWFLILYPEKNNRIKLRVFDADNQIYQPSEIYVEPDIWYWITGQVDKGTHRIQVYGDTVLGCRLIGSLTWGTIGTLADTPEIGGYGSLSITGIKNVTGYLYFDDLVVDSAGAFPLLPDNTLPVTNMATELLPLGQTVTLTQNVAYALPTGKVTIFTDASTPTIQQSLTQAFTANVAVTLTGGQADLAGAFVKCTSGNISARIERV